MCLRGGHMVCFSFKTFQNFGMVIWTVSWWEKAGRKQQSLEKGNRSRIEPWNTDTYRPQKVDGIHLGGWGRNAILSQIGKEDGYGSTDNA